MALILTPLHGIPDIKANDSLADIIDQAMLDSQLTFAEGDILVLAQKIVSKAEGRLVNINSVTPSERAKDLAKTVEKDPRHIELILQESCEVMRTRPGTIIVQHKNGFVCANAGIDHSNVRGDWGAEEDWVLLLPEDADRSARLLRDEWTKRHGVQLGVMIIDSHGRAWRQGTVGVCIGLAGMPGVVDLRGTADLYGYRLRVTQVAAADELAAAASLMMGQAAESTPVVHIRGFPYPLREGTLQEMIRPKETDLFR